MRVGLAVEMNIGYLRDALSGIASYARERKGWLFDHYPPTTSGIRAIMECQPDGLILGTSNPSMLLQVAGLGVPIVNIGIIEASTELAHVGNDDLAIGEMGAAYFIARGYRHFGFAVIVGERIERRAEGFARALEREGFQCSYLRYSEADAAGNAAKRSAAMEQWLKALEKPAAVFCANDHLAWALTEHCARVGISVPSQLSVLGVDNDPTVCALSEPTLSSIQTGAENAGYEAARLLEQYVNAELKEPIRLRLAPIRVVERRSTDAFAINDEIVQRALQFMRENLKSSIDMDTFAKRFGCSRRKLERRFQEALGQAPTQAWATLRTNEARRLLAETDLSIEDVSYVAGFNQPSQLSNALKKQIGMSPSAFRKRARP